MEKKQKILQKNFSRLKKLKAKFCFVKMEGWFFEKKLPGAKQDYKIGFKIKRNIFSGKSKYQKIEIFDTHSLGRILVLDGIIQLSQKYEFIYHEMISHLALFYHQNPKKILIVGGGDGGV